MTKRLKDIFWPTRAFSILLMSSKGNLMVLFSVSPLGEILNVFIVVPLRELYYNLHNNYILQNAMQK